MPESAYVYRCDDAMHVTVADQPVVYPAWNQLPQCPHDGCSAPLRRVTPLSIETWLRADNEARRVA